MKIYSEKNVCIFEIAHFFLSRWYRGIQWYFVLPWKVPIIKSALTPSYSFSFSQFLTSWCSTTLPQDVSQFSPCHWIRSRSLEDQQLTYAIKSPTTSMPFARLNKGILGFFSFLLKKPFLWKHACNWLKQAHYHKEVTKDYTKLARRLPQNMTMSDFYYINQNFQLRPDEQLEVCLDLMKSFIVF